MRPFADGCGNVVAVTALALLSGEIQFMVTNMATAVPLVKSGRLRGLGVSSPKRAAAAPDISTIAESGVPGYESGQWYGLFAPAGTPREILAFLHKETLAALHTKSMQDRLAIYGLDVVGNSADEFSGRIKSDIAKWKRVVKDVGIPTQ